MGIYNAAAAATEFEHRDPPYITSLVIAALERKYHIKVHYGRWLIRGYPRVFLFDLKSSEHMLHKVRL